DAGDARRPGHQDYLPGQYRPDRYALPDRGQFRTDLCGGSLQGLAACRAHHPAARRALTFGRLRKRSAVNTDAMNDRSTLPVGFTMGDAAGIGPEIIVKLFAGGLPRASLVYGDAGILKGTLRRLGLSGALSVETISSPDQASGRPGVLPVMNRWQALPSELPPGQLNALAGRGAYEYLCHAIDDAQAGKLRAIVTAPLNKKAMQAGGIDYPGHTEILAERTATRHYAMMLANDELRVILATIHVALTQVGPLITYETELETIRLAQRACLQAGIRQPRVAVAGLNPHAGE